MWFAIVIFYSPFMHISKFIYAFVLNIYIEKLIHRQNQLSKPILAPNVENTSIKNIASYNKWFIACSYQYYLAAEMCVYIRSTVYHLMKCFNFRYCSFVMKIISQNMTAASLIGSWTRTANVFLKSLFISVYRNFVFYKVIYVQTVQYMQLFNVYNRL